MIRVSKDRILRPREKPMSGKTSIEADDATSRITPILQGTELHGVEIIPLILPPEFCIHPRSLEVFFQLYKETPVGLHSKTEKLPFSFRAGLVSALALWNYTSIFFHDHPDAHTDARFHLKSSEPLQPFPLLYSPPYYTKVAQDRCVEFRHQRGCIPPRTGSCHVP